MNTKKPELASKEVILRERDFEIRKMDGSIYALTFSDQDIVFTGTEKECRNKMPEAQKEFDNFLSKQDTIKNTLEIDRSKCDSDSEYLVLSSMLDDGSYRHDACFPYNKIMGSPGWKRDNSLSNENTNEYFHIQTICKPDEFNDFYYKELAIDMKGSVYERTSHDLEQLKEHNFIKSNSITKDQLLYTFDVQNTENGLYLYAVDSKAEIFKIKEENFDSNDLSQSASTSMSLKDRWEPYTTGELTKDSFHEYEKACERLASIGFINKEIFNYIGVDVYPNGAVEVVCCDKDSSKVDMFMKTLDEELKKFPGIATSIESNRGPGEIINGQKLVIMNSIKEKNRPLQKHVLQTLDKFKIDYSNTGLSSLKKIIQSERVPDVASILGQNAKKNDRGLSR